MKRIDDLLIWLASDPESPHRPVVFFVRLTESNNLIS